MSPMPKNNSSLIAVQLEVVERISTQIASAAPDLLGRELANTLHVLTHAKTVMFIIRRLVPSMNDVIYAFPSEKESLFSEEEKASFLASDTADSSSHYEKKELNEDSIQALLSHAGEKRWLRFPLYVGGEFIGVLLLLGLPPSIRMEMTTQTVQCILPILALALRNSVMYLQVVKQGAKALIESEERFSKAFHANPAPLAISDLDTGQFIDVNEECLRMHGYLRHEMVGHTSWELSVWVDLTTRDRALAILRAKGSFRNEPVQFRINHGEIKDVLWSAEVITLNNKKVMLSLLIDVTESKKTEKALSESEERFSKAFNANPAALVITDIDTGRFIDVNEKWVNMLGYTRQEMVGHTSWDLGIWADVSIREKAVAKLKKSGRFIDEPVQFRTKSGDIRNAFWSAEIITLNGHNVMLSLLLDYTERKRAEEAVQEAELRYQRLMENLSAGVVVFDTNLNIVFANTMAASLFGLSTEQMLNKTGYDSDWGFLHEDGTPVCADEYPIRQVLSSAYMLKNITVGISRGDNKPVWELCNIYPMCDANNTIVQIVATFSDITERKRAEEALRESEERFSKAFQSNPAPLVISEIDTGKFIDVNAKWTQMLEYTREDMLGRTSKEVGIWAESDMRDKAMAKLYADGYLNEERIRFLTKTGGTRHALWSAEVITLNGKRVMLSLIQDYTDRKRAEDALRTIAESGVAPGEDIFRSLVKQLATSQGKRHALLARIDESDVTMAHTIAVWSHDQFRDNFSYELVETPCLSATAQGACFIPCDIQRKFPHNQLLAELNVVSYWGVSLRSTEGKVMGLLAVMDDRPMEENPQTFSLLNSFAVRAASEMERRRIEEKYQTLFKEMLDGFAVHEIICDEAGTPIDYRYLAVNPAFERMTGQRAEWIIGKTMQEVLPQKEILWIERFGRVALTGEPIQFEEYSETLDRYYELSAFQPQPKQFACIVADITDRKQAEAERQELEQRYHTLVDNLPIGVFRTTPEPKGRFLMVNAALLKMCGYDSVDELLNTYVVDLYVDPYQRGLFSAELLEKGTITAKEVMFQRADKIHFWAAISCQVFYNQAGEPECFDGSVLDITERKKAEEALLENERRLSYALSATSDAVWEWNCVTHTVYYSPRWYEMLGYDPIEYAMNFDTWETLCHPDDFAITVERIHSVLEYQKDQGYETEFRMRHKNGSWVWILGRGNVVERAVTGEPLLLSGTNTDITERKRAEEDRIRLEDQLRQAQKMEAVGQLAGGVAHDFNNLLQVILGHLDLFTSEDGEDNEEVHVVRLAAERAADLTRQLLAFSRRQIIQPVNLDLNDLIEGVLKMVRRVIGEHIELHFLPGNRLGTIHADKGQIEQVLMNLCVNARDAMLSGGSLTIETENVVIGDAYCREHLWATEGRYVLLSVTDTGHGMDEATREQIFEPFFTTKEVGQGTGLGLATVHGIVKQHNGLLYVYSEVGKGTAFKIYFPIVERPAEEVGTKIEAPVVGGTETILVAEDEEGVRSLVCRMLQTGGYTVLKACNGQEAIRLFEEHVNEIDLALLDVMMPKLGGREVMEYISAKCPRIRFLFSSGYSESAIHTNFVIKKGIHLISKPYSKSDLLRAVRDTLDGSS